jgi:hypothetical protein
VLSMEYKKTLLDQLYFLAEHTPLTYSELQMLPTFERNYHFDNIIFKMEQDKNGWG